MVRPCFLIIDRESSSAISTRKLVVETAKFNVITAYSSAEAVEILQKFPTLDGVVADSGQPDMPCDLLIDALKAVRKDIPVIIVNTPQGSTSLKADYNLDSFEPRKLLSLLQNLHLSATDQINLREQQLENEHFNS